jgi:hypothetical protein
VNETEVELSIGETVLVGDLAVTLLDVEGDAIHVRVEPPALQSDPSIRFDRRAWFPPR